jgi:hypothetical protein
LKLILKRQGNSSEGKSGADGKFVFDFSPNGAYCRLH